MTPYLGEIKIFAGTFAPRNWAFCNGQLLSISQNQALFSLLGTTYGGNGTNNFALPDLRGRGPIHQGQGPGLSARTLGERAGSEEVTLITTQIPQHTHLLNASTNAPSQSSPTNGVLASPGTAFNTYRPTAGRTNTVTLASTAIGLTGGTQPHSNLMPFVGLNFIIALQGVFPSRN